MVKRDLDRLSRRERQIMEIIFRLGEAGVSDVLENLADPPSYSAVRGTMRVLVEKGVLKHRRDGQRYVFRPTKSRESASRSALKQVVRNFFGGSPTDAIAALLDSSAKDLGDDELKRLEALIEEARGNES